MNRWAGELLHSQETILLKCTWFIIELRDGNACNWLAKVKGTSDSVAHALFAIILYMTSTETSVQFSHNCFAVSLGVFFLCPGLLPTYTCVTSYYEMNRGAWRMTTRSIKDLLSFLLQVPGSSRANTQAINSHKLGTAPSSLTRLPGILHAVIT